MSRPDPDQSRDPAVEPRHEDFATRHAPTPIELPLDDGEASTNVDLKTQMIRFIITGAGSGVLDFGLTILLQYVVGADFWIAKSFGFILGTTTAYLLNRRWTFEAPPSTVRFLAVVALYAVTFFVNVGLYTVLSHAWPVTLIYSFIAYVIAQGTATVINFVVQRLVIFRIR
ncbi:GtrA family protein [Gordonia bronchialis DSM 43247]|uniref:GtrA family protein n=1 Tax=Gordonia bronchialis (strain ATCC 25592 / DSM 43247 / BCRC 13721 / JCM 3198 / KCTC 3076 / NBRC 16047 / NCTC 10667) TaxID=526226 RepID=D0LC87_GORB4|nr:GtrA family protein [Gordonia bronchialis]ACY19611.1 GtrA family protein [Gordonia bronchialis DSM 43247]MCC3322389.1 GtrA family protein [Gordonia bronchialis]QGS26479.1 GtrA family protein [Gordonia bronchialis]STQ62372.1 GtrA-like protein [Gordonia bronchialis]